MSRTRQDVTHRLERLAVGHSLEKLFRERSLHPDEAVADALGIDHKVVKQGRFMHRLLGGHEAAVSGTNFDYPTTIAKLREVDWIRPATELSGSSVWDFLRGTLLPNVGIADLVDHHIARVGFTRVQLGSGVRARLAARGQYPKTIVLPMASVLNVSLRAMPTFLESTVTISDKLTIVGLLCVEAHLAGRFTEVDLHSGSLDRFCHSTAFKDAFGSVAYSVRTELKSRLLRGQLLVEYGHRPDRIAEAGPSVRVLLPMDAAEGILDGLADMVGTAPELPSTILWRARVEEV